MNAPNPDDKEPLYGVLVKFNVPTQEDAEFIRQRIAEYVRQRRAPGPAGIGRVRRRVVEPGARVTVQQLVDLRRYVILDADKSTCPNCGRHLVQLAPRSLEQTNEPHYYLCRCGLIVQAGESERIAPPEHVFACRRRAAPRKLARTPRR